MGILDYWKNTNIVAPNYSAQLKKVDLSVRDTLDEAIRMNRSVIITYQNFKGEGSERTLHQIRYSDDFDKDEYIAGFCELRNENRTFKIARIAKVEII